MMDVCVCVYVAVERQRPSETIESHFRIQQMCISNSHMPEHLDIFTNISHVKRWIVNLVNSSAKNQRIFSYIQLNHKPHSMRYRYTTIENCIIVSKRWNVCWNVCQHTVSIVHLIMETKYVKIFHLSDYLEYVFIIKWIHIHSHSSFIMSSISVFDLLDLVMQATNLFVLPARSFTVDSFHLRIFCAHKEITWCFANNCFIICWMETMYTFVRSLCDSNQIRHLHMILFQNSNSLTFFNGFGSSHWWQQSHRSQLEHQNYHFNGKLKWIGWIT